MPNTFGNFGFVKKAGDTMTGDLNLGLNTLILNDGEHGGCIVGHATSADKIRIRNMANTNEGTFIAGAGYFDGNVSLAAEATVDGVDVSEIQKPVGGLYLAAQQNNLVSGTWTTVTLNSVIPNFTDGIENTGANFINPGVAGLYLIVAHVVFTSVVADKEYSIRLNYAVSPSSERIGYSLDNTDYAIGFGVLKYMDGIQSVKLEALSVAGVDTVDIAAGLTKTFLTVQKVRLT